jgi:hypothetical protein
MRFFLLGLCSLFFALGTRAQVACEALAGNRMVHYINYIDKDLDSLAKWNFFNLNRFTTGYDDGKQSSVSIEGQLTYQIQTWVGVSAGGGFYGKSFVPTLGLSLSYANQKGDFFVQVYPTMGFLGGQGVPSALGLVGYTPKIEDNWGVTSQLIFSFDPIESSQIIRVGASYKNKFQMGIGIDMLQQFETKLYSVNLGPFFRINL